MTTTIEPATLSPQLQELARQYVAARRKSGEALLEAARALAEARAACQHGEWYTFLEATGTSQDVADRLLAMHRQALDDARYADAVRSNFLTLTTAAELASAPPAVRERLLSQDAPPTQAQIRAEKRAANPAAPRAVTSSAEMVQPGAIWQSKRLNGEWYPYRLEYVGDDPIAASGQFVVYGFFDRGAETPFYVGKTQEFDKRMSAHAIGQSSDELKERLRGTPAIVRVLALPPDEAQADEIEYALILQHKDTVLNRHLLKWEAKTPVDWPARDLEPAAPPALTTIRVVDATLRQQIEDAYSGDRIADEKPIRKPLTYDGKLWVGTSGDARRIVPRAEYAGACHTYRERSKHRVYGESFYTGMIVQHRGQEYVITHERLVADRPAEQPAPQLSAPATPPFDELLGRLDVLGYTRVGAPRVKGMTTYHSFLEQGTGEELELAEGELPYWLTQLEEREAARQARRAEYEDAQARFARLGWRLTREDQQFALYDSRGTRYAITRDLAPHLRTLLTFEAGAATRAAETAAPAAIDDDLADVRGVGDRATYERQEAADQRRLTEAEHLISIGQYAAARGSLDEVRVATWRRDQLLATIPAAPTPTPTPAPADAPQRLACTTCGETLLNGHFAGQCGPCYRGERLTLPRDPRGRAIVLLRALEAVLPKLPKPESLEDLSAAISDLNECTEGDEATHWLRVGWALLDMIADEVAT